MELVTERMRRVDLLTSRDVAAAAPATKTVVGREERQVQFERLLKIVVVRFRRNSGRYFVDAEIESQARTHRGKSRLSSESLAVQLAMKVVLERMPTTLLTIEDARSAARVANMRSAISFHEGLDSVDGRIHFAARWPLTIAPEIPSKPIQDPTATTVCKVILMRTRPMTWSRGSPLPETLEQQERCPA
ncbi:hypothetical protein QMG61_10675 [Cryobacterium sp. PH31-AA6]|uniref:hypothetical protein n=1 Tax=Cryobacterium sp. PH31-AA6 TaxID=3046205 RepID=UPI0024BB9786|nr:hypothetical protein [Cryobacterium sp. PH31-AA6]MDJ0324229.1 hypothetical protein [Cryobacterium sp. PH31-AA6]